jgi:gamma-glutamylaminecyclotransferase
MSHLVFVYGTLKRGQHNHNRFLATSTFLGPATTAERWRMITGGYPVVLPNHHRAGAGRIRGELYEVDDQTLEALDRLEGNGHLYLRREVPVVANDGISFAGRAWMYVGLRPASWFHSQSLIPRINGYLEWPRQNNTL